MIIIIEKSEVIAHRVSIVHEAQLSDLEVDDLIKSDRLTWNIIAMCDLLIVTEKEARKFRVFKDPYDIFDIGKIYDLNILEVMLRDYTNAWLWRISPND